MRPVLGSRRAETTAPQTRRGSWHQSVSFELRHWGSHQFRLHRKPEPPLFPHASILHAAILHHGYHRILGGGDCWRRGPSGRSSKPGNVPKLRRQNRIRSIHASLAIENNTLSLEQVTSVIAGKRVLGQLREIQEVKNAFAAYAALPSWNSSSVKDLLAAHRLMLQGLVDDAGKFPSRSFGIAQGKRIVHLAPPADQVPGLMKDLLGWLRRTDAHPLIAGCLFHYELDFIHPFADGNSRMGRLWQTLILSQWNPLLAFLPVEAVIRDQQADYYKVLAACDNAGNSTAFIEFLLSVLLIALREAADPDGLPIELYEE